MSERSRKKVKLSGGGKAAAVAPNTISDPRFANVQSDPRYRLPGKKHKVKVDSRFSQALKDDDFSRRAKVDRYGRPLETDAERKRLKRKYEFEDDEIDDESDEADDDNEVQKELRKVNKTRDVLREGRDSDSSSFSSSEEDSDLEEDEIEEAELAPQTHSDVPVGEVSSRLAVVNLDWDNIRAQDLMAVFSSFVDTVGKLQHVAIYPSEFGKERLQREELEGPPKEIFANSKVLNDDISDLSASEEEEDDEVIKANLLKPNDSEDFDSQALRRYQLERLRYFYAVLTFSSPSAAKAIYDAVDGTEYLSTANFFDLRFVPEDTDFSTDTPREECSSIPADYKPNEFVTDALQHSKVKLTWDAEDTSRKEAVARAFRGRQEDIDENDLKAYLGSDSSSSESETEEAHPSKDEASTTTMSKKESSRAKMRALLGLAPEPTTKTSFKEKKETAPVGNVQITFSAGLSGNNADEDGKKRSVFVNTEEEVNETTLEKYVRKERERKEKRRQKAKAGRSAPGGIEGDSNEELTKPAPEEDSTASKSGEEDLGFDDPFFVVPSASADAAATKSASKKLRKEERLKKKQEREQEEQRERKQRAELELLMVDDALSEDGPESKGLRHFDMRDIERAERAKRKKDKKKRKTKREVSTAEPDADAGEDDFKVNASDPRFAGRLFENHEFAIDPTNPRYKETKGMKELLEEGRRRKKDKVKGKGDKDERGGLGKGDVEVKALVEKLKRRKQK